MGVEVMQGTAGRDEGLKEAMRQVRKQIGGCKTISRNFETH